MPELPDEGCYVARLRRPASQILTDFDRPSQPDLTDSARETLKPPKNSLNTPICLPAPVARCLQSWLGSP